MNLIRIAAIAIVVFFGISMSLQKYLTCQVFYRDDTQVRINGKVIKAEVAKTSESRSKGLGGRGCIGSSQGMLFVFKTSGYYPFWMKDMRFSIDMIWIDANHRVVKVQPDVAPSTYPRSFTNDRPAEYALELKAGRAAQLGIQNGSLLQFSNP